MLLISVLLLTISTQVFGKSVTSSQCGGTIEGDANSLTYPNEGESLVAGTVCVWTIHLEIKRDFKFRFETLDVGSDDADGECGSSGISLYSLTNLVPGDSLESYRLCNGHALGNSTFYLGETVAVVVLYVDKNNVNPGSGFSLAWEGTAVDPLRTRHLSSFSSLPSGVIRYPVIGEYPARTIATWIVETDQTSTSPTEVLLNDLDLEAVCGFPEFPCACDALIVYDISEAGYVKEVQRLCDDLVNGPLRYRLQSRFLVAIFTDMDEEVGDGNGFEIVYYLGTAGELSTTEGSYSTTDVDNEYSTTIEYKTTVVDTFSTTESPGYIVTRCGEILSLDATETARVEYKMSTYYNNDERCVWTIRFSGAGSLRFELESEGFGDTVDKVTVTALKKGSGTLQSEHLKSPGIVTLPGSVAIITFASEDYTQGTGFSLSVTGLPQSAEDISAASMDKALYLSGSMDYPGKNGPYTNDELSTFLLVAEDHVAHCLTTTLICINITYDTMGLESGCYDSLNFYQYSFLNGWVPLKRACGLESSSLVTTTNLVLVIFESDGSNVGSGFSLSYEYKGPTKSKGSSESSPKH